MVVENLFGDVHMNMHYFLVGLPSCHYAFHEDETVIVKLEICFHTLTLVCWPLSEGCMPFIKSLCHKDKTVFS